MDTGEGGYPTFFILDAKWNPLDLTDPQVALLGRIMEERKLIPVAEVIQRVKDRSSMNPRNIRNSWKP